MSDHLEPLVTAIKNQHVEPPPPPWVDNGVVGVGGLIAIGFQENTELLLVISLQGRGVFDANTGEKIARDYDNSQNWYDPQQLLAEGIGPLEKKVIRMSGLHGGGLPLFTSDGWGLHAFHSHWMPDCLLLTSPGNHLFKPDPVFTKISADETYKAWGFSASGKSLVIATGDSVTCYAR